MIQSPSLHPICRWAEDGSLVEDGSGSFKNWFLGQPNNADGGQDCMHMRAGDGKWYEISCTSTPLDALCAKPIASAAADTTATTTTTTSTSTTTNTTPGMLRIRLYTVGF